MKKPFIVVAAVVALAFGGCAAKEYGTITTHDVKVTDLQRIVEGDSSKWLVLTNKTTFENVDSLLHMKFNSSDLQGRIERGSSYRFTTTGWRVPTLSMYPNIIKIEKLENDQ